MTGAAIYARYSTDLQHERSIDDQIELCRAYAEREGLDVVAVFDDKAKSGASILNRDGLIDLLAQARAGAFRAIVVEHTDRISRSMRDLADIHERMKFLGVEIRAVHSGGAMSTATIGLFGLVSQMQREDGAQKVRRGMAGVVRDGRHAGGRAYGYRPDPARKGGLVVDPAEAAIVKRIFTAFVAGVSPRAIAHGLNRDGVAPPRGSRWNASTLNGHAGRGTGILRNALYAGRIVWNKVRMLKDPDSGRRVSRVNPESERQAIAVPELAIVPDDLFAAAQARKARSQGLKPERQRRPRYALSGLLRCGACGAGLARSGRDKSGRTRIRCAGAVESGTCPDPKTFYLDTVERAVFGALKREMAAPFVIAEYVKTWHAQRALRLKGAGAQRRKLERAIAAIEREHARVVDHLAKGIGDEARLGAHSKELGAEGRRLAAELAACEQPAGVVALHPGLLRDYARRLEDLEATIARGAANGQSAATDAIRSLVESVTVNRDRTRSGGVAVIITGRLEALLGPEHFPNRVAGLADAVVAEARFRRSAHPRALTFELRACG